MLSFRRSIQIAAVSSACFAAAASSAAAEPADTVVNESSEIFIGSTHPNGAQTRTNQVWFSAANRTLAIWVNRRAATGGCISIWFDWSVGGRHHYDARAVRDCDAADARGTYVFIREPEDHLNVGPQRATLCVGPNSLHKPSKNANCSAILNTPSSTLDVFPVSFEGGETSVLWVSRGDRGAISDNRNSAGSAQVYN